MTLCIAAALNHFAILLPVSDAILSSHLNRAYCWWQSINLGEELYLVFFSKCKNGKSRLSIKLSLPVDIALPATQEC